ncbi:hypothetical protein [Falsiroseomonas sp.]|uniref:hypothetical protein n=1 Tax=Falsiroseomonas sp. TaxID=2870721 RepID=UPI003561EE3B
MKHILSTTAIAAAIALGTHGFAGAQAVDPNQPGSASGGILAQSGQTPSGQMGQPRATQGGMGQSGTGVTGSTMGQGSGTAGSTMGQGGGATGSTVGQGSATGQQQATRMGEEQIRTVLRARGYSDIEGLARDGDQFKVEEAKRYGETVEDLRIDARTGQVPDEKRLSEDQARNLLRDQGYSDVSDVSRDGDTITAKAKQGEREARLRIDANTGVVSRQTSN